MKEDVQKLLKLLRWMSILLRIPDPSTEDIADFIKVLKYLAQHLLSKFDAWQLSSYFHRMIAHGHEVNVNKSLCVRVCMRVCVCVCARARKEQSYRLYAISICVGIFREMSKI